MLYLHKEYTAVYSPVCGKNHVITDTVEVLDPDSMDLEATTRQEPAKLASGNWRVQCSPECERHILDSVQYSGATERAIPLTSDEEKEASAEAKRGTVEVANLARAMHQMARERAVA